MSPLPPRLRSHEVLQSPRFHGPHQRHEHHPRTHEEYVLPHAVSEDQTRIYFSRFPFSAYLVTFACEVHNLIVSHQAKITLGQLSVKYLESYSVDLSDYLYYFNDLMAFGTQQAV